MSEQHMIDFITSKGYGVFISRIQQTLPPKGPVSIWQKSKGEIVNERTFRDLDDAFNTVVVEAEAKAA